MFSLVIVNKMNYVGLKQGSICLHWTLTEKRFHIKSLERFTTFFSLYSELLNIWEKKGINYFSNEIRLIKTIFSRCKKMEISEKGTLFGTSAPM